jgi:hypothetical protein
MRVDAERAGGRAPQQYVGTERLYKPKGAAVDAIETGNSHGGIKISASERGISVSNRRTEEEKQLALKEKQRFDRPTCDRKGEQNSRIHQSQGRVGEGG